MKKSELVKLIKEEIKKLNEAQHIDIGYAMGELREFNRGNINIGDLARRIIKHLGFKLTPLNIDNAEGHLKASMNRTSERFPIESSVIVPLYDMLK